MKITIDTKEDSHEDIQKVIKILSSLIGQQEVMSNQGNLFGDSSGTDSSGSDMFADSSSTDSSEPSSSEDSGSSSEGSGGGVFNMFNTGSDSSSASDTSSETATKETTDDEEKKENLGIDMPEVEEYE